MLKKERAGGFRHARGLVRRAVLALAICVVPTAWAEPTSDKLSVVSLRPYVGGVVYVQVSANVFCGTDTFAIDVTQPAGKEIYAAVLAALTGGKQVRIEASNATGCNGWATRLQSVFLYP